MALLQEKRTVLSQKNNKLLDIVFIPEPKRLNVGSPGWSYKCYGVETLSG
jgi:hypothetical protein